MDLQENDGVIKIKILNVIVCKEISRCVAWNSTPSYSRSEASLLYSLWVSYISMKTHGRHGYSEVRTYTALQNSTSERNNRAVSGITLFFLLDHENNLKRQTSSMERFADCRDKSKVAIKFWNFTLMPAKKSLLLVFIVQSLPLE